MLESETICSLFMSYNNQKTTQDDSPFFNFVFRISLFNSCSMLLSIHHQAERRISHTSLLCPLQPSLHDNKDLKHKASERYDMWAEY